MSKSALLLMDLQNGIVSRIADDPDFLARIKDVAAEARRAGMPVIHVIVKFRPNFPEVSKQNKAFAALSSGALPLYEGNPAADIHAAVAPQPDDIIVTKRRVSAFSGSDLEVVLRAQQIDHIVLAGIATSGVVLSTLRAADDMDYKITVLADCCADKDTEIHRVLTEKVFISQAEVTDSELWTRDTLGALQLQR